MSEQYWDSAQSIKELAREIDFFMYEDGDTREKNKTKKENSKEETEEFLEHIRLSLWREKQLMQKDMGYEL